MVSLLPMVYTGIMNENKPLQAIFAHQVVVVLGGAGFLGSHIAEFLSSLDAQVLVLDNFSRGTNRVKSEGAYPIDYIRADVVGDDIVPFLKSAHTVINCAADVAGVIYNQSHNLGMFASNMPLLTAPVMASQAAGVPNFLQVSSVCVYSPDHNNPAIEPYGHTGNPHPANHGYSWAKRMGERAVMWSEIPRWVIVRPTNMYGPRDYFHDRPHVIPALVTKFLNEHTDKIELWGSGRETREFLYVADCARGVVQAAGLGQHGATYNLGTIGSTSVQIVHLAKLIQEIAIEVVPNYRYKEILTTPEKDGGDPARSVMCEAARRDFHWIDTTLLAGGLEKTIQWYVRNRDRVQA